MAFIIPVNSDGNREILVSTGSGEYRFRTYYTQGQDDGWLLDINDPEGNPLLAGRRLTPGAPNIIHGFGDTLRGMQVLVVVMSGTERDMEGPGNTFFPLWFGPGEENPYRIGDPMVDIPAAQWAFKEMDIE